MEKQITRHPGASPGCLFLSCRGDAVRKPGTGADSGPSFPASPLIQDDGLLRRDFARRGFFRAAGLHRSSQSSVVSNQPSAVSFQPRPDCGGNPWICMVEDTFSGHFDFAPMIWPRRRCSGASLRVTEVDCYARERIFARLTAETLAIFLDNKANKW
jgi:hypothetical protein